MTEVRDIREGALPGGVASLQPIYDISWGARLPSQRAGLLTEAQTALGVPGGDLEWEADRLRRLRGGYNRGGLRQSV